MAANDCIYLDYNATTPLDERVFDAMQPYFRAEFGNAASRHHVPGRRAAAAVEVAREQAAIVLHADPREITFTSGATEANNLAILGCAQAPAYRERRHIVSVRTEHRAVLDPCRHLEEQGYELTLLGVDGQGRLDLEELAAAIRDDTLLVSVMHGNSETGVLHPIADVGALCRDKGTLFHTDATQSFGKEPLDVTAMQVDLLSFSAHKFYGPKGVGGLFVRRRNPRVRCEPLIHGGGHEGGRRSGTLNVPGIVGLGRAAEICHAERVEEQPRIAALRDRLQETLVRTLPGARPHCTEAPRLAGTLNIALPDTDAEELMASVPTLAISTASACTSASLQPSYVLGALGLDEATIRGSLRFSVGRFSRTAEVDHAVELIAAARRV